MSDRNASLGDGMQLRIRGQRLPAGVNSTDDRILDRNHARIGIAIVDGAHRTGESRDGNVLDGMSPDLLDGALGVSSTIALKGDAQRQLARRWMGSIH